MLPIHPVEELLWDIDQAWQARDADRIRLRILGSSALFLQTDYRRGTKDSDVLETAELRVETRHQLLALAGKGAPLHRKHGMYVEILASAFPFLAEEPNWVPLPELDADLTHFTVEVLDVVDVVVAKLARLHGADRGDIKAMVLQGRVDPVALVERFDSAIRRIWHDARAEELPRYVRNLHSVQRDLLGVAESLVELPSWVDDE